MAKPKPEKKPAEIDVQRETAKNNRADPGIYKLEKGRLIVAMPAKLGGPRPKKFEGKGLVVFTFERFNTGQPDGVARLYLDGQPHGALSARQQTFTWDVQTTAIALGLSYIGLLDELSILSRALTGDEIRTLFALEKGVGPLAR